MIGFLTGNIGELLQGIKRCVSIRIDRIGFRLSFAAVQDSIRYKYP